MTQRAVQLGLRENAAQFGLLIVLNAFVGAMVGLERSTLPLVGQEDFGLGSSAAVLSFIVAFGAAKALTNLAAGSLATTVGRRRLLVLGWLFALPVPLLIGVASTWEVVVVANLLLGVNQGLTWSMTVVMKIDLVGPKRRGLALGLNEAAGYGGVALAAGLSGWLAADLAARDVLVTGAAAVAVAGLAISALFVRDTGAHVELEQHESSHASGEHAPRLREAFAAASWRPGPLRTYSQAGFVNNLNDALAWGLIPLYLAANGAEVEEIGLVAATYPAVWATAQIGTGAWSDRIGRKLPIVAGMLTQAAALGVLAAGGGELAPSLVAAVVLGLGTALVYPTLIAAISDEASPVARASVVGVYRFWRDSGYVAGALLAGVAADGLSFEAAIVIVAVLTALSGLWVAAEAPPTRYSRSGRGERRSAPARISGA